MTRVRVSRWVAGAALGAVVLVPSAASAGSAVDHWGYAIGRHPGAASYQPGAGNSRDDLNSTVTIQRSSAGSYVVTFPHISSANPNFGTVLATAISSTGGTCMPGDFDALPSAERVVVKCFSRTGVATDTPFSTNYLLLQTQTGKAGYLLADQPGTVNYTPDPSYQFNSTGATDTVSRIGLGTYDAMFPGLGSTGGHAQAMAAFPGGYCEVGSMTAFGSAEDVRVYCRNAAGAKVDDVFSVVFTNGQGLKKPTSTGVAYLLADKPFTASYVPAAATRFESNGGTPQVRRANVGHYRVKIGGFPAGGAAQVTTFGSGNGRCELSSLPTSGNPVTIGVVCVKPDGTAVDSKFLLEYTK